MRTITSYEVAGEVAALTGKEVVVRHGEGFSVGTDESGIITLTVDASQPYMNATMRAGILHEACHILYTDGFIQKGPFPGEMLTKAGYKDYELRPMFDFLNAFEDIRIQLKCEKELPGARYIFQTGNDEMTGPCFKFIEEGMRTDPMAANARGYLCSAITCIPSYTKVSHLREAQEYCNESWDEDEDGPRPPLENPVDMRLLNCAIRTGFLAKISKLPGSNGSRASEQRAVDDFAAKLEATATTMDGFTLAKTHFMDGYLKFLPPDLKKRYEDAKEFQKMMEGLLKAMEEAAKAAGGRGQCGSAGSALARAASNYRKTEDELLDEADTASGFAVDGALRPDQDAWKPRIKVIDDIADQMRSYLAPILDRVKEWQERGSERLRLKRGKVDGTQLYRVAVGDQDVFRRDIDPEVTDDVAYSVVIDLSGSMCGEETTRDPLNVAFGIGAGINRALRSINKPCSVITFSSEAKVVTGDGERCTQEKVADGLNDSGGGTNIDSGINRSLKELDKRAEKTKVQFVISDGDVSTDYLESCLEKPWKHGVTPYVIYITEGDYHVKGFEKVAMNANAKGNPLKYAVISPKKAEALVDQLSRFVESTLEGKKIH